MKEAKKLGDTLVNEEAEQKRVQKEKEQKRMNVIYFNL